MEWFTEASQWDSRQTVTVTQDALSGKYDEENNLLLEMDWR